MINLSLLSIPSLDRVPPKTRPRISRSRWRFWPIDWVPRGWARAQMILCKHSDPLLFLYFLFLFFPANANAIGNSDLWVDEWSTHNCFFLGRFSCAWKMIRPPFSLGFCLVGYRCSGGKGGFLFKPVSPYLAEVIPSWCFLKAKIRLFFIFGLSLLLNVSLCRNTHTYTHTKSDQCERETTRSNRDELGG